MQSNLESFEEIRTPKRTRRSKKSSGYFMCFPFHPWAKWAITGGSTDFSQRTWPHKWALFQAWAGVESHFMTLGRRSQWERLAGRNLNLSRRCSKQDYKKTDGAQHYFEKMRGAWTFWKVDTEKAHQWAQKCHQWQRTAKQIPHQFFKKIQPRAAWILPSSCFQHLSENTRGGGKKDSENWRIKEAGSGWSTGK